MSQEVLNAQIWLNETYGSNPEYIYVSETGYPGTATSMALVSALQIELGLSTVTGIFATLTSQACDNNPLQIGSTGNRVKILQHGLYCKGYNPRSTDGEFTERTLNALIEIQEDAGLSGNQISDFADGMRMKAVLGVDEYKRISTGDYRIRELQQNLNHNYLEYTGLCPCDGVYSRGTNTALIYAFQAEENLPLGVANGYFGVTTTKCSPTIPYMGNEKDYYGKTYTNEEITEFIRLAQYALYCIGANGGVLSSSKYDPGEFNGIFDDDTKKALKAFQKDSALEVRNEISLDEWMSFFLSTGNPNRKGEACDCASRITPEIAEELKSKGYGIVGRYLTGDIVVNNTRVAKNLLPTEMKTIFDAGLRLFVIFQDYRQYFTENPNEDNISNYFTEARGYLDAEKAFSVAKTLGVPRNEIIYFSVDYDFTAAQVTSRVVPYFKGIYDYAMSANQIYKIGIYGSRNTCILVKEAGYSESSFVGDLSTGYSGNLGFPLPDDWAFDQIKEFAPGEEVSIGLDKNVLSYRYLGFSEIDKTDEWDLIHSNGTVNVLLSGPTGEYAVENPSFPVYWAKVWENDHFIAKYPMYDSIPEHAFFSMRKSVKGDNIRYVYFRDKGGRLNAGYIDISDVGIGNKYYNVRSFAECQVYRGGAAGPGVIDSIAYPDGYYEYTFLLTTPLSCKDHYGDNLSTLPIGTKVKIPSDAVSGASYPYMVQAVSKMLPDSDTWEFLDPNYSFAYLDLGFEYGVMPYDRSLITGYM